MEMHISEETLPQPLPLPLPLSSSASDVNENNNLPKNKTKQFKEKILYGQTSKPINKRQGNKSLGDRRTWGKTGSGPALLLQYQQLLNATSTSKGGGSLPSNGSGPALLLQYQQLLNATSTSKGCGSLPSTALM